MLGGGGFADLAHAKGDIFQGGHGGKQIELLKHHAGLLAYFAYLLAIAQHAEAIDNQIAAVNRFQDIDAAQEGGFARARGPDHHRDLIGIEVEIEPIKYDGIAKALGHIAKLDHGTLVL